MNAPSSNSRQVVSIRHVATGFMARSHIILVVMNGIAHLVACKVDRHMVDHECEAGCHSAGQGVDREFGALNPVIVGDDGMEGLARHLAELRMRDAVNEPIRWCCAMDSMSEFRSLPKTIPAHQFQIGRLADLPVEIKADVVKFSHAYFAKSAGSGQKVTARCGRVTYHIAA